MTITRSPMPGWHVIRHTVSHAYACIFGTGHGWWIIQGRNQRFPDGWEIVDSLDSMLNGRDGFSIERQEVHPNRIVPVT